jgi:hypothetical protein
LDDAVATGAAYCRAGDFATFGFGLGNGDILSVQVDQPIRDAFEPLIRVMTAEIAVAGIEVDADHRALDQMIDSVKSLGVFAVLLVRLQANEDPAGFSEARGFLQGIPHQDMILRFGGPVRFWTFIRVNDGSATFGGEPDCLFKVLHTDLGFAQRCMGGEPRELNPGLGAGSPDPEGIVEHGDTVKVARFAEQFPSPVHHGFDVIVAQFGGFSDAPLEGFVVVSYELEINAKEYFSHKGCAVGGWTDRG